MHTLEKTIKDTLYVSSNFQDSFLHTAIRRNKGAVIGMATLGIVVEFLNLLRVLLFSASGLHTLNNRIYFAFYCSMLALSVVVLLLQFWCRRCDRAVYHIQVVGICLALLWHTLLSSYDTISTQSGNALVLVTFLLCFSALFLLKPCISIPALIGNTVLYLLLTYAYHTRGTTINVIIAAGIACIVSITSFQHVYVRLVQRQKLMDADLQLQSEREKFRLSQEHYALLIDRTTDIIFNWDIVADSIDFSNNWKIMFGYPQQISGFTDWISAHMEMEHGQKQMLLRAMENIKHGSSYQEMEILIHGVLGTEKWMQARILTQFSGDGRPIHGIGMLYDVMEHKQAIAELEYAVQKDPMTGILNKAAFESYVKKRLRMAADKQFAMMVIDMDDFKSVNDTHGHPCGDYVLTECSRNMQDAFGAEAEFGRIGGDEFVVFTEITSPQAIVKQVEWFLERMSQIQWQGIHLETSCSVGITFSTAAETEYAQMYFEADDAMYTAKQQGKGRYHILQAT